MQTLRLQPRCQSHLPLPPRAGQSALTCSCPAVWTGGHGELSHPSETETKGRRRGVLAQGTWLQSSGPLGPSLQAPFPLCCRHWSLSVPTGHLLNFHMGPAPPTLSPPPPLPEAPSPSVLPTPHPGVESELRTADTHLGQCGSGSWAGLSQSGGQTVGQLGGEALRAAAHRDWPLKIEQTCWPSHRPLPPSPPPGRHHTGSHTAGPRTADTWGAQRTPRSCVHRGHL